MSVKRTISVLGAVALMAVASFGGVKPASAQSIFASPRAASAAGVSYQGGGSYSARDLTGGTLAPNDGTAPADPYAAIFAQIQTATSALLSGPGALAFGVLILGLGFGVAWRLTTKGVKSIAK